MAALALLVAIACHPAPDGVQLGLGGDRRCSDPVWGQLAMQCCIDHDNAYWAGGCRQDFHVANAEFLTCQLLHGVDPEVAVLRWRAVESPYGWRAWTKRARCTRGPAP